MKLPVFLKQDDDKILYNSNWKSIFYMGIVSEMYLDETSCGNNIPELNVI